MSTDSDLRSKLIRLAHENPDVREHLLPLLKSAGTSETKAKRHFNAAFNEIIRGAGFLYDAHMAFDTAFKEMKVGTAYISDNELDKAMKALASALKQVADFRRQVRRDLAVAEETLVDTTGSL